MQPFKLKDQAVPGRRTIAAVFLVDPNTPIVSTSDIPPPSSAPDMTQPRASAPSSQMKCKICWTPSVTRGRHSRSAFRRRRSYAWSSCVTASMLQKMREIVTKRRSSWACIGNPKPEQETIEGTHAQETPAYQRRPTTCLLYTSDAADE